MSQPSIYLETSVVSYLTSRPSRDLVVAAHQQITRTWWDSQRSKYALYVSDFVLLEIQAGDAIAARERQNILAETLGLPTPVETERLAQQLLEQKLLPPKAQVDAYHVAIASISNIDYLLTWNCKHIANATTRDRMVTLIRDRGYKPPVLCTPEELMGWDS